MNSNTNKIFTKVLMAFSVFVSIPGYAGIETCMFPLPNTQSVIDEVFKAEAKSKAEKEITAFLSEKLLSTSNGSSAIGSVLESFVPKLELSGLVLNDEDEATGEPLTITRNLNLFGINENPDDHDSKIELRFHRNPEVSTDLASLLGEQTTTLLQSQINEYDDFEVGFSYSYTNENTGRLFSNYADVFSDLVTGEFDSLTDTRNITRADLLEAFELEYGEDKTCDAPLKLASIATVALKQTYDAALLAQNALDDRYQTFTNVSMPERFSALVSNQPQLILSGSYRSRNDFIGADEYSVKASYEWGRFNLNGLKRYFEKNKQNLKGFSEAYSKYVTRDGYHPVLRDDRFAFSLEYSEVDDFRFEDETNKFFKEGGETIAATLSYGRALGAPQGKVNFRVDADIKAIEFLSNTEGVDRVVGSLTFTYRIDDKLSIPLTFEYANRSEFLSEDSSKFGTNIGFKYDLNFTK